MTAEAFANSLVLAGPTASGKTELGVELAERLNAEIISMDSMALYLGMDIGTAKPSLDERRRVRHHMIDVLEPWESSSVAWWLEKAAECCREIEQRGKRVLLVGGTPFYLKALLRGLFDGPPADLNLRRQLLEESERDGSMALHQRLAKMDPVAAQRIHPNDVRRIIRALEVLELTGKPISSWQQQWLPTHQSNIEERGSRMEDRELKIDDGGSKIEDQGTRSPPSILDPRSSILHPPPSILHRCLWLETPRNELYCRINDRVRIMVANGWIEETKALLRLPQPISKEAGQALGYREMFAFIQGKATLEETIELIQIRSRNFAKRQISWFRHLPECRPVTRELTFKLWGLTMN